MRSVQGARGEQIAFIAAAVAGARAWLLQTGKGALVVTKQNLFSYFTGGEEQIINANSDVSNVALVVTQDALLVVCAVAEVGTMDCELLRSAGFIILPYEWMQMRDWESLIAHCAKTDKIAYDRDPQVYACIVERANQLRPYQAKLYRALAQDVGVALNAFAAQVVPGMSEREAAALASYHLLKAGVAQNVLLIGSDERAMSSRHFQATCMSIGRRLMLIGCFRRNGLVLSLTRDIYFQPITVREMREHERIAALCARLIGACLSFQSYDVTYHKFEKLFADCGLAESAPMHPIAGLTGYELRSEWIAPGSASLIEANHAYAFNPCINGYKSEDTWLFTDSGAELLSADCWPRKEFPTEMGFASCAMPLIR